MSKINHQNAKDDRKKLSTNNQNGSEISGSFLEDVGNLTKSLDIERIIKRLEEHKNYLGSENFDEFIRIYEKTGENLIDEIIRQNELQIGSSISYQYIEQESKTSPPPLQEREITQRPIRFDPGILFQEFLEKSRYLLQHEESEYSYHSEQPNLVLYLAIKVLSLIENDVNIINHQLDFPFHFEEYIDSYSHKEDELDKHIELSSRISNYSEYFTEEIKEEIFSLYEKLIKNIRYFHNAKLLEFFDDILNFSIIILKHPEKVIFVNNINKINNSVKLYIEYLEKKEKYDECGRILYLKSEIIKKAAEISMNVEQKTRYLITAHRGYEKASNYFREAHIIDMQDKAQRESSLIFEELSREKGNYMFSIRPLSLEETATATIHVDTEFENELRNIINLTDGGNFAIIGSRGSGKSTIINKIFKEYEEKDFLKIKLEAPRKYDILEFLQFFYLKIADEVEKEISKKCSGIYMKFWNIYFHIRRNYILFSILFSILLFVLSFLSSINASLKSLLSFFLPKIVPITLATVIMIALLVYVIKENKARIEILYEAKGIINDLSYLITVHEESSLHIRNSIISRKGKTFQKRDYTLPFISDRIRDFVARSVDFFRGGALVIIDEIDKMDPSDAIEFLNDVRGIISAKRVYFFFVLPSTFHDEFMEGITSLDRKKSLDSSIDRVIKIDLCEEDMIKRILKKRIDRKGIRGLDEDIISAIAILSKGVPRDALRHLNSLFIEWMTRGDEENVTIKDVIQHILIPQVKILCENKEKGTRACKDISDCYNKLKNIENINKILEDDSIKEMKELRRKIKNLEESIP